MSSLRRIAAVARVETLQLLRSRVTFTLLLLVPALQVLLFGFAIRPTGAEIAVAVAAQEASLAAPVVAALRAQPGLRVDNEVLPSGGAEAAVHAGRALIGVEVPIPSGFTRLVVEPRPLRIIVDSTNAALIAAAIPAIETAYWREVATRANAPRPGLTIVRLYNPAARADWTFLPALIGVTVMIGSIMLGTLSLARERETGTWEALLALPLRGAERLAGKLIPHIALGTLQGCLVLAAAVAIFAVPARGSVIALVALLPLYAATHLVIGHAIAARAPTQLAALQGAVAFYLPAMLLSGFLYPFESLPAWARTVGEVFPLTHFIRAAREVLLRGDGAAAVAAQAGPMVAVLIVASAVALIAQSRRLD